MLINTLFVSIVLGIGIITSYEDFKFGKIRNKWIVTGLLAGAVLFTVLFIFDFFSGTRLITWLYLERILINFILAIIASFFVWKIGGWSAGDAKLFIVFAWLLPLHFYEKSYLPFFPSLALLINIFTIIFVYLMLSAIIFSLQYGYVYLFKDLEERKIRYRGSPINFFEISGLDGQKVRGSVFPMVISNLIRNIFKFHNVNTGNKKINIGQLKANMILAPHSINKVFQKDLEKNREKFGIMRQEGLSEGQVDFVKKWSKVKNIEEVRIMKTFPFAIWMLAGVLLTLSLKMSVINLIIELYKGIS